MFESVLKCLSFLTKNVRFVGVGREYLEAARIEVKIDPLLQYMPALD